jgi:FAD/FMN-containing dehydrogenase
MKEEIKKFFKGEVLDDKKTISDCSRDASLFEIKPKLVAYPKDSEDVRALVKWAVQNKEKYPDLSITARSAGTDMTGGPLNNSIILDFTRYMNKMISFPGNEITVQPGMFYRDFEKITAEKGLFLPSYPASKSIAALGGMVSNNSGGEKTLKYGKTEDYVLGLKVVLWDGKEYEVKALGKAGLQKKMGDDSVEGKIYRDLYELINKNKKEIDAAKPKVSKNSAGYYVWNVEHDDLFDLNKLIVGSQGTLGIITEIKLRLVPIKPYSRLAVVFMDDINPVADLVNKILKLDPESLEAYDDKTLKLAIRFFTGFLKNKGFFGSLKFAWSFWPDLFILMRHGMPKLVMLAEFAGDKSEVGEKCLKAKEIAEAMKFPARITVSVGDTDKYFEIRRESFNLLRKHVKGKRTAPFIDDIIVRPEFMPKFLPELNKILEDYPIEYTIAGHPGNGNFHIIPLMDMKDKRSREIIPELSGKVYSLVLKYGGSITAEHNDGIIRTPYLEKMYGAAITDIFRKIKAIFDPDGIFNPGKKTGGTMRDIDKYLAI